MASALGALALRCWVGLVIFGLTGYLGEQLALALSLPLAPNALAAAAAAAAAAPPSTSAPALHHCAVATQRLPGLAAFLASAAALGDAVQVLGHGDALAAAAQRAGRPFPWGLRLAHALARARALPPAALLLMTDAFDVVQVAAPAQLVQGFEAAARAARAREPSDPRAISLVIGTEATCWPDAEACAAYPASDHAAAAAGGTAFVNGGCWMGRAGAVAALLGEGSGAPPWSPLDPGFDDQRWLRQAYLASRANASLPRLALDHGSALCMNMEGQSLRRGLAWDARAARWRKAATGAAPCLLHFNGDKTEFRGALAARFAGGRVCFAEHAAWCSGWAWGGGGGAGAAGLAAALACSSARARGALAGAAAAVEAAGLRVAARVTGSSSSSSVGGSSTGGSSSSSSSAAPTGPAAAVVTSAGVADAAGAGVADLAEEGEAPTTSSAPPALLRWPSATALAHLAVCAVTVGPLLLLAVLSLGCPLCSRPMATPMEAASGLLWPPTGLVLGRGLLAAALVVCCGVGVAVVGEVGGWLRGRQWRRRVAGGGSGSGKAGSSGGRGGAGRGAAAVAGRGGQHWRGLQPDGGSGGSRGRGCEPVAVLGRTQRLRHWWQRHQWQR
jgi:hypothetical protein